MQTTEKFVFFYLRVVNLNENKYYHYFDVQLFQDPFFVSKRYKNINVLLLLLLLFFFSKLPTKLAFHADVLRGSSRVPAP